jgi:hypothetical protein
LSRCGNKTLDKEIDGKDDTGGTIICCIFLHRSSRLKRPPAPGKIIYSVSSPALSSRTSGS